MDEPDYEIFVGVRADRLRVLALGGPPSGVYGRFESVRVTVVDPAAPAAPPLPHGSLTFTAFQEWLQELHRQGYAVDYRPDAGDSSLPVPPP